MLFGTSPLDLFVAFIEKILDKSLGAVITLGIGYAGFYYIRWRMLRRVAALKNIETVVLVVPLVKRLEEGKFSVRLRSAGQTRASDIFGADGAAHEFLKRVEAVTPESPMVNVQDAFGSAALDVISHWVAGKMIVLNNPTRKYVMGIVSDVSVYGMHQYTTVLLVRVEDLEVFAHWVNVREHAMVERGCHSVRLVTLVEFAHRYKQQVERLAALDAEGLSKQNAEEFFELALPDFPDDEMFPLKPANWAKVEVAQILALQGRE